MTIQKSIVDSAKEESDFDKSCHCERSQEFAGTDEQAAVGLSEGFRLNGAEWQSFYFHKLTEHIDNTAQGGAEFQKGEQKANIRDSPHGIPSYGLP